MTESFTSNHQRHCLTNVSSSLASRICSIVANEIAKKTPQNIERKHYCSKNILCH